MPERGDENVIRAAGAVVWRSGPAGIEVALVHRPRYDDWSHPKGKCRRGEHALAAAVREVSEETGLRVVLGRPLTPSSYQVTGGIKRVRFWAGRCDEPLGFVPNDEVDEVIWLPLNAARTRLSYTRDVALLDELSSAPVLTSPLILLRHAAAGRKAADAAADPADLTRPLDAGGVADAKALAGLLSCFGRCQVISSPAERCIATVRPYASAADVPVQTEPAFMAPPPPRPGEAAALSRDELLARAAVRAASVAASQVPTVVCAHRENLPVLIDAACGALGGTATGGPPLGKGAFLVLQSANGALVSCERHEPTLSTAPAELRWPRVGSPTCVRSAGQATSEDCRRHAIEKRLSASVRWKETDMADDMARAVEIELAELAEQLTTPGERECLRCYLLRMINEFGCDGSHRWTIRWRDMRAAQPRGLLERLQRRGGCCCDCEVLLNVFPDYPEVIKPLPCAGVARPGSVRPCDLRGLRDSA